MQMQSIFVADGFFASRKTAHREQRKSKIKGTRRFLTRQLATLATKTPPTSLKKKYICEEHK
jgi:hypothetical protein